MSEYILSDSDFNDTASIGTHILKYFLTTRKLYLNNEVTPLNILSESFKSSFLFLYDNPELELKYPEGLVTETLILLPVDKFKSMRINYAYIIEPQYNSNKEAKLYNDWVFWACSLTPILIKNLELKLNINFSNEEKNTILDAVLFNLNCFKPANEQFKNIDVFSPFDLNLSVVKNKDLIEQINDKELLIVPILEKMITSYDEHSSSFKQWLSKYPHLYSDLPSMQEIMKGFSINPISHFNIDKIRTDMSSYWGYQCSLFKPLIELSQFIDYLYEKYNHNFDTLMDNFKEQLFPLLFSANESLFTYSLIYLKDIIFPSSKNLNNDHLNIFCQSCSNFYSTSQRKIIIKTMTSLDMLESLSFQDDKVIFELKRKEKAYHALLNKLPPKDNFSKKLKI